MLEKIDTCQNNPKKSYTERKAKHKPLGYLLVTCYSFDKSKTEWSYYRGKDCMKIFCKDLRDQAMKIINYEKKKEIVLTNEEKESYEKQENCYICKKEFCTDKQNKKEFKLYCKVRDHCHYTGKYWGAAHSICNLRYRIPKEIPVVFHNGSTYECHFIIKQLVKKFKGNFKCLGENTEKYITFSVPITKQNEEGKIITYKLRFIDVADFLCKANYQILLTTSQKLTIKIAKNVWREKRTRSECEFIGFNDNRLNYQCKECNDKSAKSVDDLIKKFPNTYKFCSGGNNKFVLLLRKAVYPYEYMDSWKIFNETSLPLKEAFYSRLYLEDVSNNGYLHAHKVWKVFEIKSLGGYHDLYVQYDTFLLADVFENLRKKFMEMYELDPAHFLSAPGLAWQACLKKTGVELELVTDNGMLIMFEEGARGGIS